jgi:TonB family protein
MVRQNGVFVFVLCCCAFAQPDSILTRAAAPDPVSGISPSGPGEVKENFSAKDSLPPIEVMPRLIHFVKALYPDSLIEKGIVGDVEFDLLVSDKGSVDSAAIVKGLHPVLDSSALAAVRSFSFAPAMSQGKPLPVLLRYVYRFSLENAAAPIDEAVSLLGTVTEKGTRANVPCAVVALSFEDTVPPKKHAGKFICVDKKPNGVPLSVYLDKIGKIKGQKLEDGRLITTTDSLGRFSFASLPCGTIRIKIVAGGCKPITATVCIKKGAAARQLFWVERDSYDGNEIVVYGKEEEETPKYDVGATELKRVPGFNGEAVKLLQAMPGVARPVLGGNEIIVRGADNNQSKFYIDGIEMPYLYHEMSWDFMYRGILNADALQSASLYPGGWGVGYGNAIGGIIDFKTRPAQKDRWHGVLDLNIKGPSLLFETPLGKNAGIIGSFRISALFDEIGFFKRRIMSEQDSYVQDYWDYSLRFDWQIAPSHHITLTAIGANDSMYQFSPQWEKSIKHDPSKETTSFGKSMVMGIAAWTWAISPDLENVLRYGIRPTSYKAFYNEWADFMNYSESKSLRHDVRDELKLKVNDGLMVTGGLDMRLEPFTSLNKWYSQDTVYTFSSKSMFGPLSAYLTGDWKPFEKLTISPGLRYDYYTQLDYRGSWLPEFWDYSEKTINNHTRFSGDPSLRVSGRYELNRKHAVTASIGNYNESPDSLLMTTMLKKDLISEKGSQYTLGYEWNVNDILSLNCQGYFGTQWDKFRWKASEEPASNDSTFLANNGKARMEGLEIMLRHCQTSHFFGWLGYSLSYSERYDYGENKWVEYDYNALNNLQLVADWFFKWNQSFGLRFQYTDGYPYTPQEVQLYDATNFQYIAKAGATNSKRHTPYLGLDLRYEKKFIFKRSMLTAYIEGERLFHLLQYVKDKNGNPLYHPGEYNIYNYDYSGFESIPVYPMGSLGLTWEF